MSGIFERLARLAKAEFNHIKSVMADRDDDAPEDVRAERLERLRRAREELERAEAELRRAREGDGASAWGREDRPRDDWRADDGARAWARDDRRPDGGDAPPRRRDTPVYSEEIRLAYAALELPLGSDKDAVNKAYRELLARYHPDKHQHNPQLLSAANELTRRIKEARDRLLAWLG